jgi:Family of unknown function (DUF5321)
MNLKNEMKAESRKADAKIALLREVIQRVQKGEDFDVERLLGTGDPKQEQEWKEGEFVRGTIGVAAANHEQ